MRVLLLGGTPLEGGLLEAEGFDLVDGEDLRGGDWVVPLRAWTSCMIRVAAKARVGTPLSVIGGAHFFARRFEDAVPKLLLAIQEDASFPQPYRWLAACYAHMGRLDDAREIVARLRAITPVVTPDASFLRNAEHRELFLLGLRIAAAQTG
jgi:hypothetical protein